jgi:hypothetical protein
MAAKVTYRQEDEAVISRAQLILTPWYYHPRRDPQSTSRYNPTSHVLTASPPVFPLAVAWTSPILVTRTKPPSSGLALKYEAFAVITRTLCKIWSPNTPPDVPYPGVLPDGWSWENSQSWTKPGFEDGSLGRFDFSYIPQAIPARNLLHWAFVENPSNLTYPSLLKRNPLDAWNETAAQGGRPAQGLFHLGYIQDIIHLWDKTRKAVLELPPAGSSISDQIRHPSQTLEWHSLQSSAALVYFVGLHLWEDAIQVLTVWHRAIADARAYLACRTAIDHNSRASRAAADPGSHSSKFLGCWSNELDVEAIKFLVDQHIPVYFIEDIATPGTRIPRRPKVYHDPSALGHDGIKFVTSTISYASGSSCRPAPGCDRAWASASHTAPWPTSPSLTATNHTRGTPVQQTRQDQVDTSHGSSTQYREDPGPWTVPGPVAQQTYDLGGAFHGWNTQFTAKEDASCSWAAPTLDPSHPFQEPDYSLPPTLIQPLKMRKERAHARAGRKAKNHHQRKDRLLGRAPVPPTYEDIALEPPPDQPPRWENWKQCDCDLPEKHMFHVSKAPQDGDYALFYDIEKGRRLYIEDVQVRNPLSGALAPVSSSLAGYHDESDSDMLGYEILGLDIPQGFVLQHLDFWGYNHGSKKPQSTTVWWENRRPLHVPLSLSRSDGGAASVDDRDAPPPPYPSGGVTSTGTQNSNTVPVVRRPDGLPEESISVDVRGRATEANSTRGCPAGDHTIAGKSIGYLISLKLIKQYFQGHLRLRLPLMS